MTEKELIGKVHSSVYHQCQKRGYAAPVDVLMEVGVLSKDKYEEWRFGRINYLEKVCSCNLRQLSFIMRQIRSYSQKAGYKPSYTYYKRWGVKKKDGVRKTISLRFSKNGNPEIEKAYATHYVDLQRTAQLKKESSPIREWHESISNYHDIGYRKRGAWMCNLSLAIYNEGFYEGISKGIAGTVKLLRKNGFGEPAIMKMIIDQYQLTLEEAQNYILISNAG